MRIGGKTAVVLFCGLLALALVAAAGAAGKAFAHRGRGCDCRCDAPASRDCCGECCGGEGPCGGKTGAAPCPDCGKLQGKGPMPPMMEGMKGHVEDVRKRVEALRKSEKALAGIADPAAFRAAVVEHLKMVDDLQEAHLKHMESMPARMTAGDKKSAGAPCS